jgi:hypothetical protein
VVFKDQNDRKYLVHRRGMKSRNKEIPIEPIKEAVKHLLYRGTKSFDGKEYYV